MSSVRQTVQAVCVALLLTAGVGESALGKVSAPAKVTSVALALEGGETVVAIETSAPAFFGVTQMPELAKILVDVKGAGIAAGLPALVAGTGVVAEAVVEEFSEGMLGKASRVTLHLAGPVTAVKKDATKKKLRLSLSSPSAAAPAPVAKAAPPAAADTVKEKDIVAAAAPDAAPATAAPAPKGPKGQKGKILGSEDPAIYAPAQEETASALAVVPKQIGIVQKGGAKKYSGMRIDLDFKDADMHNILRLLADVGHINIVVGDDVGGSVTLSMKNVPWELALDVILEAKGLDKVKISENVVRVAPKETLEKERQMKIQELQHKKLLKPLITKIIPVSYAMAQSLKSQSEQLLSGRGSITIDERTNVLIVRDVAENLSLVEQLIRSLDTQTPQVLIEARIVETSTTYVKEVGIQWGGHFVSSSATGNPTGIVFPSSIVLGGGGQDDQTPMAGLNPFGTSANPNFAVNLPAAVGSGSGGALGISLGTVNNNANLSIRLSALENDGVLKIISAPKILTLDNEKATIEQGTLIPYSQISAQGVQTAFQEAKLSLEVKPHVTADGSILMDLLIKRDEPDFNNRGARGDPTILKRQAQTTLMIQDAKTAVIGGIYTRNYGKSISAVPWFGKIPILGWLFKKKAENDRKSELLIFITPRIVNKAESIGI